MNQDETLQEIREARAQIWHECGEDWNALLSFYQTLEQEEKSLVIRKPQNSEPYSLSSVIAA